MPTALAKAHLNADLYDRDFFEWTVIQARALREERPAGLDWSNLAEEIESLGRSDKRSIASNLNVIIAHLLKWQYQPQKRKAGWKASIAEHRARLRGLIKESPSLRSYPAEVLPDEYPLARLKAIDETELPESALPEECPFTIEQILDPDFWPEKA
jgi:hypothetical protein